MRYLKFWKTSILLIGAIFFSVGLFSQENYKEISKEDSAKIYGGDKAYPVEAIKEPTRHKRPKNVIFMIGDGMGTAQIYSGLVANHGRLYLNNFNIVGFATTFCADKFVTDSGAAGTALATGKKTYHYAIGVNADTIAIENIREKAAKKRMSTGVISTSAITHATPASFIAHQPDRGMYEEIAKDIVHSNVDIFIGGGYKHFTEREDSINLIPELAEKGFTICRSMNEVVQVKEGKLAGLLAQEHTMRMEEGRGDMLPVAVTTAIDILDNNKKGFFLMVEGSQIDWACHQNNTSYIVNEVLDFDKAIGEALKFAAKDKETLIIVTADHETGGFGVIDGSFETGRVVGRFLTNGHSGVMVPVFAFGPGSELFSGIYDNTEIPKKIMQLLKID